MAGKWVLLLAMLVQSSVGQELSKEQVTQVQQAVDRALTSFKAHKSRLAIDRRLAGSKEMPDFSKMCKSDCWKSITEGMVTMIKKLESDPVCAAAMSSDAECKDKNSTRRLEEEEECMFTTTCTSMAPYCADLSALNMDTCTTMTLEWMCSGMCGTACKADHKEEKKLFCGDDDSDDSEEECDKGMDGDEMSDAFNMMCSVNPAGKYCYDMMKTWQTKGAFQAESAAEEFPDPCAIDCSTTTGQAIEDMGCCLATMLGPMEEAEAKAARGAIYTCGGKKALMVCPTASLTIPVWIGVGGKGLDTCPTTAAQSAAVRKTLAGELGVKTKAVSLVVCKATGSTCGVGGRRLEEAKNTMDYTVTVKGSSDQIAAKQAAMEKKIQTTETSSGGKSSVPADSAVTSKAGQSSLSLLLGVLVVSAILK